MALTEAEKRPEKKEKPLTKVVIRRLPPTMTQEQFLNQVSPVPDYNYLYYVKGDMTLGENAFARAYINFVCPEDVYSFKERFDNYVFVDTKGHEYAAVVEFAPFQKIPKKRGKNRMDPKCNTIESDSYYLDFVAILSKPVEQDEKPEYTLQLNERSEEKKDTTTPLLEYIKNKRAHRLKIREVRREERERRKKEFEKRKDYKHEGRYYDEKKYDERSPAKVNRFQQSKPRNEPSNDKSKFDNPDDKIEKSPIEKVSGIKPKEKKFEDRKERKEIKPRFPKKEYVDNRDFKREDYSHREYRSKHYDDYKREDSKTFPKKVKKYSEKREERRMEAQKAELKKQEQKEKEYKDVPPKIQGSSDNLSNNEKIDTPEPKDCEEEPKSLQKEANLEKEKDKDDKLKDLDRGESNSRRIRNKDRPTIPLYRPGMLSRRKQNDDEVVIKPEDKKD
ncbi:regulator of nonsense transcripts 3B-like [Sitophilus oryzae]|uniref:Regulator of nonsense transcripts 3B-like n=1 Tax=Sitophilus oryzae TaxID=7048 RepID=A0A6J2XSZ4_SITOR|nr:regulator of nonsense transcripts 3B-like [Sitophilus oryzae]